ncbi:MAG: hypothetical protein GC161_02070 [Planctomycetaceae bacterium]|nr:hypothetical protein [Planctomycetaceae bacterium]
MGGDGPNRAVAMQATPIDPAASAPLVGAPATLSGPYTGPDMGQLASYLGISLAMILLVAGGGLLVHRLLRGGWRVRASQRSLRVVDLLPLAGKNQLAVVQVYDRTLVLGIGDGGVRLVTEWDADGPLPSGPAPKEPEAVPSRSTRAQALLAMLGTKVTPEATPPAPAPANFEADLEAVLERVLPRAVQRAQAEPETTPVRRAVRAADDSRPRNSAPKPAAKATRPAVATRAAKAPAPESSSEVRIPRNPQRPTIDEMLRSEGVLG